MNRHQREMARRRLAEQRNPPHCACQHDAKGHLTPGPGKGLRRPKLAARGAVHRPRWVRTEHLPHCPHSQLEATTRTLTKREQRLVRRLRG
jgi:hypothetical protein